MGAKLANRILATWKDHDIDVVIPVPDTSRTAALECAGVLGIKYREGFLKNRYIGRTFIMPQQGLRKKSVRQKLSPIASEFLGRNVLLVDDSIVRGTTCGEIVLMAREAGAKRVYIASAAPPVSGSPFSPPYPPVIPPPPPCHPPAILLPSPKRIAPRGLFLPPSPISLSSPSSCRHSPSA
jgi:glutamine phosphoribosylpyrophosphate amidotransferase